MSKNKTEDPPSKPKVRKSRSKGKNSNQMETIQIDPEIKESKQKTLADQSLEINLTKELEFKISLPHPYKNTLGLF